jgi:hypothetical protein
MVPVDPLAVEPLPVDPAPAEPLPDVAAGASLPDGKASRSLRTTGASMVEDALRTNSPSSLSLAITSLLD